MLTDVEKRRETGESQLFSAVRDFKHELGMHATLQEGERNDQSEAGRPIMREEQIGYTRTQGSKCSFHVRLRVGRLVVRESIMATIGRWSFPASAKFAALTLEGSSSHSHAVLVLSLNGTFRKRRPGLLLLRLSHYSLS